MGGVIAIFGLGLGILFLLASATKTSASTTLSLPPKSKDEENLEKDIADVVKETEKEKKESSDIDKDKALAAKIPIKELDRRNLLPPFGIDNNAWENYVYKSISGKNNTLTNSYLLGIFLFSMKALQDLGYVRDVKKTPSGIWKGEWNHPFSLEWFLSEPKHQYDAFEGYSKNHYKSILLRYGVEGENIIGKKDPGGLPIFLSISGLMGVSKQAGLSGLDKWLKDSKSRKPSTNMAFTRTNGIF